MSERRRGRAMASLAVVAVLVAGCGGNRGSDDQAVATTTVGDRPPLLCDLLAIPLRSMDAAGTTFVDVVADETGEGADDGISAMVSFALMAREPQAAGRFGPVLRYLGDRSIAASSKAPEAPPPLTAAIRANATALDAEIEREGCG